MNKRFLVSFLSLCVFVSAKASDLATSDASTAVQSVIATPAATGSTATLIETGKGVVEKAVTSETVVRVADKGRVVAKAKECFATCKAAVAKPVKAVVNKVSEYAKKINKDNFNKVADAVKARTPEVIKNQLNKAVTFVKSLDGKSVAVGAAIVIAALTTVYVVKKCKEARKNKKDTKKPACTVERVRNAASSIVRNVKNRIA